MTEMQREFFEERCLNLTAYARKYGLNRMALSNVLSGKFTGERVQKAGHTYKVITQLKKDGIWKDELPWIVRATKIIEEQKKWFEDDEVKDEKAS